MHLVYVIIGTRPEAIKMAPLILKLKKKKGLFTKVLLTGQHKDMVNEVMNIFKLKPDLNLQIMKENQSINDITQRILNGLQEEFKKNKPNLILVQGDTSTSFAAALAAFYENIPIAHVEAGLRTNNLLEPFPEEANRRLISQIATLHFAPTNSSKDNLLNSGITDNIIITGNTVIDALIYIAKKTEKEKMVNISLDNQNFILATIHRRENWGEPLKNICKGFKLIIQKYPNLKIVIPMHPNSKVREVLKSELKHFSSIILIEPLPYNEFVKVLKKCKLVVTDSGGLQEEAPALGKPVIVLRESTERTEAVECGTIKLVGTNSENIFHFTNLLLSNSSLYKKMASSINPYGVGDASAKIVEACNNYLNK